MVELLGFQFSTYYILQYRFVISAHFLHYTSQQIAQSVAPFSYASCPRDRIAYRSHPFLPVPTFANSLGEHSLVHLCSFVALAVVVVHQMIYKNDLFVYTGNNYPRAMQSSSEPILHAMPSLLLLCSLVIITIFIIKQECILLFINLLQQQSSHSRGTSAVTTTHTYRQSRLQHSDIGYPSARPNEGTALRALTYFIIQT